MKITTIVYYAITLLMLLVLLTNMEFTTGLALWIAYIGMMILNITSNVKQKEQRKEIEKLKKEIIRKDVFKKG